MRPGLHAAFLTAMLATLVGTGDATAARVEAGAGLDLVAGYDSNPLMMSADGPGGAFGQASFSAGSTSGRDAADRSSSIRSVSIVVTIRR